MPAFRRLPVTGLTYRRTHLPRPFVFEGCSANPMMPPCGIAGSVGLMFLAFVSVIVAIGGASFGMPSSMPFEMDGVEALWTLSD